MMKVGDLVELSAYGKKLKLNEDARRRVGMILNIGENPDRFPYSYKVHWFGTAWRYHSRQELKKAKVKKEK